MVIPGSPASLAGLLRQDIILSIDNKPIGDERDVVEAIVETHVGAQCRIHVLRPSLQRELDLIVTISDRPEEYR